MRVLVSIDVEFEPGTITAGDAAERCEVLFERALKDGMDILQDGAAVVRSGDVYVEAKP